MNKILIDFKREQMKREFKAKVNTKIQEGKEWVVDNKDLLIALTPVVLGGLRIVGKQMNMCKQESVKNLYCYDRSLGHYWRLRRELTNKEWIEIESRKKNGEKLGDILSSMRVLK